MTLVTRLLNVGLVSCGLLGAGCISTESPLLEGGGKCEEFQPGEPIPEGLELREDVRKFMGAAAELSGVALETGDDVLAACAGIALDLEAEDTWSSLATLDQKISNSEGTGACDAAWARVEEGLIEAGEVGARVALSVTRGECHVDFAAQAACEDECAENAECDSGTIETRCEPGELRMVCESTCERESYCVGTVEQVTNCEGTCSAQCVGECTGTCVARNGTRTENEVNCDGKCLGTCTGTCSGECKIERSVGIECGSSSHCQGSCSGSYSDPVCTSEYTPPTCTVDPDCYETCRAKAIAEAVCEPTRVEVLADIETTPALRPLVDALEEHLPKLFDAAQARGPLARDALGRLGETGRRIAKDLGDLQGKELACVGAAADQLASSFGIFDVAVRASVDVTVNTSEKCD
jgi:hypothetical protein